jgi:hypothetical protein
VFVLNFGIKSNGCKSQPNCSQKLVLSNGVGTVTIVALATPSITSKTANFSV